VKLRGLAKVDWLFAAFNLIRIPKLPPVQVATDRQSHYKKIFRLNLQVIYQLGMPRER
jgi:hypothetical protein